MAQERARKMLQLIVPPRLDEAIKVAADREMSTISEYVRRVLIDRLRADGIDPTQARSSAADQAMMEMRA
jgi:hypothetical protein